MHNRTLALIRTSYLGYSNDLPEKDRKRIADEAARLYKAAVKGEDVSAYPELDDVAIASAESIAVFERFQRAQEKMMVAALKAIPAIHGWGQSVRGIGEVGLAIVIGEAGDISRFDNPAKLWKRMGLGLWNGNRQGNPGPKATAEDWTEHGYSARRRSVMWNVGASIIKAQSGENVGLYRRVYDAKKADYAERVEATTELPAKVGGRVNPDKWTPLRAHLAAQRYMEKRVLRDLWRAWRAAICEQSPRQAEPHADYSEAAE